MRSHAILIVALVFAGCLDAWLAASAQQKLTPGAVALLVNQKTPESLAVLRQAVRDPDVNVRRVAARAAGVGNRGDLAPVLLQQLEKEQDDRAAAEELRAVLFIRGPQALEQTLAAALRVGGQAQLAFGEWLARKDPERFADALRDLAQGLVSGQVAELGRVAATAFRQHPAGRQHITDSWAHTTAGAGWRSFLETLGSAALDDGIVLQAGLSAANPEIREQTRWFAIAQAAYGRKLPLTRVPGDESASANEPAWTRAGRELLRRIIEGVKRSDISEALRHPTPQQVGDAARLGALKDILTAEERTTLTSALGGELRTSVSDVTSPGAHAIARTFDPVAPGVLTRLFEALGCTVGTSDQISGVARVRYRDDGRVSEADVDTSALATECAPALGVLSALTLADPGEVFAPAETQSLLLPVDAEAVACADAPDSPVPDPSTPPGQTRDISPPRKIRDVHPAYPESAQQGRVQGTVVIESTISETGCVKRSRVMRSIPGLDLAALRAVSGWRFAPTLVNGTPVATVMTVTVRFALR